MCPFCVVCTSASGIVFGFSSFTSAVICLFITCVYLLAINKLLDDFVVMYITLQSSEIRTVCAEGFAKLLLAGRVVSPSLLTRLLLLWYNPVTEDDTRLRHCIGTFLPIYAFASR